MKQSDLNDKINLDNQKKLTGSCLCGGVRYEVSGLMRDVVNCYCTQCQKTSGHYVAATRVNQKDVLFKQKDTLRWYESTPGYQRGFCDQCGGNLFWNRISDDQLSIFAGTLDKPTGLKTVASLYEQDASDYFELPDIPPENQTA